MVSFWPFSREDKHSPKSFEKALAALTDKIQRLQTRDDTLRATHRRVKVIFTLYSIFAYILALLILTLVTGYQQWQAIEWSAIAGSPVAIYGTRYVVDLYFDWREGSVRTRLETATKERDALIKKLKAAVNYDTTKELLDKYGGADAKKEAAMKASANKKISKPAQQPQRTGFAPPPTANIPGRLTAPQNAADARSRSVSMGFPAGSVSHSRQNSAVSPSESFAPNAYDEPPPQTVTQNHPAPAKSGFLDRILDLLVGEDESAARNRIVLICTNCRTVNGQAPPGTRSLAELGRWRCATCSAWNGEESESTKVIKAAAVQADGLDSLVSRRSSDESMKEVKEDGELSEESVASGPAAPTRSKVRS